MHTRDFIFKGALCDTFEPPTKGRRFIAIDAANYASLEQRPWNVTEISLSSHELFNPACVRCHADSCHNRCARRSMDGGNQYVFVKFNASLC
jgi:hypothetical protein